MDEKRKLFLEMAFTPSQEDAIKIVEMKMCLEYCSKI